MGLRQLLLQLITRTREGKHTQFEGGGGKDQSNNTRAMRRLSHDHDKVEQQVRVRLPWYIVLKTKLWTEPFIKTKP